jgi:acetoin utilization deacetylase AcuC-like enzyme
VLAAAGRTEPVELGGDAWTGPGTHDAMLLAAGGLLRAVAAVLDGDADNAFALLRPPRAPCRARGRDGLLPLQQHGGGGALGPARSAAWSAWRSSIGTSTHGNGTEEIFLDDRRS